MSNTKKLTRRRAATFFAALGMLVMSSGVALMVAAAPAQAANKVNICHATSSDSNPYVFIQVDDDSAKLKGHLQHREDPNKRWKSAGSFNNKDHVANQAKPDLIGSFTDDQGVFHEMDGTITAEDCANNVEVATADVDWQDPNCANENTADFDVTASNATWTVEGGEAAPGNTLTITFTADEGAAFEEGAQTVFTHEFTAAESPCGPPQVRTPAAPSFVDPTCDVQTGNVILPELPVLERSSALIEEKDVDGVHYVVTGSTAPGGSVDVVATALPGYVLAEGATDTWSHTFPALSADCSEVTPPEEETPPAGETETETPGTSAVTPTVVHAGLVSAEDLRGEQGLALLVTGMIMLVVAGGLGVRRTATED